MTAHPPQSEISGAVPFRILARDGVPLGGFVWRQAASGRPVVVITAATSVRCRYHARFADYLFAEGFNVVTYDYRGIGESRPARLRGYFPAKRLGWMEDTPAGVVRDWSRMRARFENSVRPGAFFAGEREAGVLRRRSSYIRAPILTVGLDDDPHGRWRPEQLLAYFSGSRGTRLRIAPMEIGHAAIGHFAFFHHRFRESLWPSPGCARGACP